MIEFAAKDLLNLPMQITGSLHDKSRHNQIYQILHRSLRGLGANSGCILLLLQLALIIIIISRSNLNQGDFGFEKKYNTESGLKF